ncbi:sulfatase family protein [Pontiella agarivorans]|uniref:Sulfatase-like hydrolase/transferase n=1 Tax=Pontiella agarivorans TaxID=3038953 RepID=A0ABU5MVA9_9BACT|nr:sulfatase-like hydrolase/transferase [Pontiella agarivorans]MDZ8117881.1 sulfatase-like hydrolase/transferase [Pontiella agarivorans]
MQRFMKFAAIAVFGVFTAQAAEKPNFLVILADDLGYMDVGFTGSEEIFTPQLDQLAENGMICENGYVTHPYCGPSRAGLMAGRYQARFGLEINITYSPYDLYSGFPLSEKTIAERLKPAGYRTGIIGKWHMGASQPFHPNNRGFDHFYGFLSGGHDYFPDNVTTAYPLLLKNGNPHYSANEGCYLPLMRNDQAGEFNEYLTTALSRDAVEFVKQGDDPFFLYLAYNAPHGPLQAPKETIAKYKHIKDPRRRTYAAMIDEMDRGVGMVVDALKESGKFDNTVIFFLSDNGGVTSKPGHENENWANNGKFKKGKGSMHEGGSHVPYIVHWPAGIPKPGRFKGLVSSLDIAATAVALGGGDTSGHKLEGVNLAPYLSGRKKGSPHDALFWRVKDGAAWCVRTPTGKYLKENWGGELTALYDMKNDPYESTNLLGKAPEKQAELARLWNEWNAGNSANVLLQAGDYQKKRLQMYEELYRSLEEKAKKAKPVVIQ